MNNMYKKLVLDPRCLKPAKEVNDRYVYIDAIEAVNGAISHQHTTDSEKLILDAIKLEIRKNRFDTN
jgi:hypothetical protein